MGHDVVLIHNLNRAKYRMPCDCTHEVIVFDGPPAVNVAIAMISAGYGDAAALLGSMKRLGIKNTDFVFYKTGDNEYSFLGGQNRTIPYTLDFGGL